MFKNVPYIILLLSSIFILIFRKQINQKNKKKIDLLLCIIIIIFSGFRYEVGTDYEGYSKMFYQIGEVGRYYNIEWGFYGLVRFFYKIGGTPQIIFLIYSTLTIFFVYKFIYEFSENVELSWIIFLCIGPYYLSTFNGMRQWLSVSMFAYSLKYLESNQFWRYAIINAVSGLSHYSAFILIPLYPLLKSEKFNMKKIVICYMCFFTAYKIGILNVIANLLHAESYLQNESFYEVDITFLLFFIMSICCWTFLKLFKKDKNRAHCILENLNYLSCLTVFLILTTQTVSNMLFIRFNMYFFITYIAFVPVLLNKMKKIRPHNIKFFSTVFVLVGCIIYFLILTSTSTDLTPYQMNFKLFY